MSVTEVNTDRVGAARAEPVIETRALRRVFSSGQGEVEAVAGIDLCVRRGEIFGFLGPNGAGKTTTLRVLSTLLPASSGEAVVAGHDLRHDPGRVRERIGLVGQRSGADPAVSGRSELVLQGRLYRLRAAEARRRAAELIQVLDLAAVADRPTKTYSGGQRRRLDVGLGLMHRPEVLFLDEPTTGLDPQMRARLWDEIRRLRAEGMTIFLTTHYLEEADALCDRLAIIDQGRIVAEGTADELKREIGGDVLVIGVAGDVSVAREVLARQPVVSDATVDEQGRIRLSVVPGERGEIVLPRVLQLLAGAGVDLQTISMSRPSLDDVFLRKTGRSLREPAA